jgi:succinate dehydrogenase hydrophobic anchor subunit
MVTFGILMVMGLASAATLGTFEQNNCIQLKQTCANCTFVNVTSVVYPNSTEALGNVLMTKQGSEYNYTFCNTTLLGEYTYNTLGNPDGVFVVEPVTFQITPNGNINSGWSISINIFSSVSSLILMFLFLFLSSRKSDDEKTVGVGKEKAVIRFFFMGIAMVFLIAHILLTSQIINDTVGAGTLSSTYAVLLKVFFIIFGVMFLYILARISFQEVDNFKRRKGLK